MKSEANGGGAWLERAVSPPFLFLFGMALIPAFVLQSRLGIKGAQVAAFFVLVTLADASRGLRLLCTVLILLGSTLLFNLLTPFGRVLIEWGPVTVTQGALETGLLKGLSLSGLMLLSRLAVRRSVALPGIVGVYVSATLSSLNRMLEARPRVAGRGLLHRLDALFESVFREVGAQVPRRGAAAQPAGVTAATIFVVANWVLVFFPS